MRRGFGKDNSGGGFGGFGGFRESSASLSYITAPPDLSGIPQEIVVPFKNLLKKDSTTKAKALEEIISYVQSSPSENGGLDESIIEAWTLLYPRVSIDNSRRVRELSHNLLSELMKSAGKRMAKRTPIMVGPWLAGTFDRDRVVARAAAGGLSHFLNTDAKRDEFWRKCKDHIFKFANEAIRETAETLSDERSSTKEDSAAKYYRVLGSSLSLVLNLLTKISVVEAQDELDRFFDADILWNSSTLASVEDSHVRKTFFQLIKVCLETKPEIFNSRAQKLGRTLLVDAVRADQVGSRTDLIKTLISLTKWRPEIWGAKKNPLAMLQSFIKKGSQGASTEYWDELDRLLSVLPKKPVSIEVASDFLVSMRSGILSREEPRQNATAAWKCYIEALGRILGELTPSSQFLQLHFFIMTEGYLQRNPEMSALWATPTKLQLLSKGWGTVVSRLDDATRGLAEEEWQKLSESLLSKMANSLPEVSKDYQKSQLDLGAEGDRWFALAGVILADCDRAKLDTLRPMVTQSSVKILQGALDLLSRRNYKPFGVAIILQSASKWCNGLCLAENVRETIFPLDNNDQLKAIVASPSFTYLVPLLESGSNSPSDLAAAWDALVTIALEAGAYQSVSATKALISAPSVKAYGNWSSDSLQRYFLDRWLECARGSTTPDLWDLCNATLELDVIDDKTVEPIVSGIVDILGQQELRLELGFSSLSGVSTAEPSAEDHETILKALGLILSKKGASLTSQELQVSLVTRLLKLAEIEPELSEKTNQLRQLVEKHSPPGQLGVRIVQDSLGKASSISLDIDTLVHQAIAARDSGAPTESLLPDLNVWKAELDSFLQHVPCHSLSLTSSLSGAYFLVTDSSQTVVKGPAPTRDARGRSVPARMASYTSQLLSSGIAFDKDEVHHAELLSLLSLTTQLAADQLTLIKDEVPLLGSHHNDHSHPSAKGQDSSIEQQLWSMSEESIAFSEIQDSVKITQQAIDSILASGNWKEGLGGRFITLLLEKQRAFSSEALYSAKTLSDLFQRHVAEHGSAALGGLDDWIKELGIMRANPQTVLPAIAFITGFGQIIAKSRAIGDLCKRLLSEMIDAVPSGSKTLYSLVLLNACLSVCTPGEFPVDNRKLALAFQQFASWDVVPKPAGAAEDETRTYDAAIATEACRALHLIFPELIQVYGGFWEQIIQYCLSLWESARDHASELTLPYLHASLKLISAIERACASSAVASDESEVNEDLLEVMKETAKPRAKALIGLLKALSNGSATTSPCQDIVDELLTRLTKRIPVEHIDAFDLFSVLKSESRSIQTSAYSLIHRAMPVQLEQRYIDDLMDKDKPAQLPEELLALLSQPPVANQEDRPLLVQFPADVRSYLLAWCLVFDAYRNAPFKIRDGYTLSLNPHVNPFLDFMVEALGHSQGQGLKLEKAGLNTEQLHEYDIQLADAEERERQMQWLLVHIFYLMLKHMPSLFKAWYLGSRDKQTKIAIESWTTKYFSPLLISEAMDEVNTWVLQQKPPEEDEKELLVKVSKVSREITVGYEVDEEVGSIVLRIPSGYPLAEVEVVGKNRVGVSDKKWQVWIRSVEGVIKFANGSITDGLAAFRRNFTAAMKGHTECPICYSYVSSDKKMPDKRCGTCNNMFHRYCLYKWFNQSGKNTCPLCRNPIDYLGSR